MKEFPGLCSLLKPRTYPWGCLNT